MKVKLNAKRIAELGVAMTAIATLIAGCGGSSSTSSGTSGGTAIMTGIVADGYLSGAVACLDKNGNAVCDAGEPSATTNASGVYSITGLASTDAATYNVIAEIPATAIDADSGSAVGQAFSLAAPVGASFVSPLSTLVQDKVAAGATVASAVAAVNQALGIPAASGVSPLDNYVALKGAATDQTNGHFKAHEAAKTVAAVLKVGKAALGSSTGSTDHGTQRALLAAAETVLGAQIGAASAVFVPTAVNASSVAGVGALKSAIAANNASVASATQSVTINFDVVNGLTTIGTTGCAANALTLGNTNAVGSLQDLRFYVSNVALIDAAGNYSPVIMDVNGNQGQNVALLDFENATNTCALTGSAATYTAVTGKVAPGTYVGVAFDVGVPGALNHVNPAAATTPAPLQNTAMAWMWQSGRKFTKIEFANNPVMINATTDATGYAVGATVINLAAAGTGKVAVGDKVKFAGDATSYSVTAVSFAGADPAAGDTITLGGAGLTQAIPAAATTLTVAPRVTMVHLGATGCKANPMIGEVPNGCASPNRMHVTFASGFNAASNKVALDLGALFGGLNMTAMNNTWMSAKPGGMMMAATAAYFFNLLQIDATSGLPINDGAAQTVFVVK